eukprot:440555-Amphidinium_carterae.1
MMQLYRLAVADFDGLSSNMKAFNEVETRAHLHATTDLWKKKTFRNVPALKVVRLTGEVQTAIRTPLQ